jgi:hypothetical protein
MSTSAIAIFSTMLLTIQFLAPMILVRSIMISQLYNGSTLVLPPRFLILFSDRPPSPPPFGLHFVGYFNVDARINSLNTELCNTIQGDSSLSIYFQCLQAIADELRTLGDPVDDRQLINILLVGLSERFEKQASFVPMMRPPPPFAEVRSMLQWVDHVMTNKENHHQVFAAILQSPAPAPAPLPPPPVAHPPPGWRPSPNYRGKN